MPHEGRFVYLVLYRAQPGHQKRSVGFNQGSVQSYGARRALHSGGFPIGQNAGK